GDVIDGSHILVHAIGALATPTNERVSEVLAQGIPTLKIGVLAGPALPNDLAESAYSSMVIASNFDEVVAEGRRLLNAPPALRVYSSKDVAGVELASALAGAYTVALGLSDGLGLGPGPGPGRGPDPGGGRGGLAAGRGGGGGGAHVRGARGAGHPARPRAGRSLGRLRAGPPPRRGGRHRRCGSHRGCARRARRR